MNIRKSIYFPNNNLWWQAKSQAAIEGKTTSAWVAAAIQEKLNKKENNMKNLRDDFRGNDDF